MENHIDEKELLRWETEQLESHYRLFPQKSNNVKDPQAKKQKEKKKKKDANRFFYRKEDRENRNIVQKKFRSKWKQERAQERYHIPRTREYKTYGYLTW